MTLLHCSICARSLFSQRYCKYHELAFHAIEKEYVKWKRAYGGMLWERYLESILKLEYTGVWAVDVARNELLIISKSARNDTSIKSRKQ